MEKKSLMAFWHAKYGKVKRGDWALLFKVGLRDAEEKTREGMYRGVDDGDEFSFRVFMSFGMLREEFYWILLRDLELVRKQSFSVSMSCEQSSTTRLWATWLRFWRTSKSRSKLKVCEDARRCSLVELTILRSDSWVLSAWSCEKSEIQRNKLKSMLLGVNLN